jgi:hypothetical protein
MRYFLVIPAIREDIVLAISPRNPAKSDLKN